MYCRIFNPTAELVIPTGIATKEAKGEMETHSIIVEIKISKVSIIFKTLQIFASLQNYASYLLIFF